MTELDLEQIKRDREAGTPGPWVLGGTLEHTCAYDQFDPFGPHGGSIACVSGQLDGEADPVDIANAKRICRVPDLEARVISDAERIATLEVALDYQIRSKAKIAHREMFFILLFCVTVGGFSIAVSVGLV